MEMTITGIPEIDDNDSDAVLIEKARSAAIQVFNTYLQHNNLFHPLHTEHTWNIYLVRDDDSIVETCTWSNRPSQPKEET